ncbi:MAG: 16S rRNA (cytidine(1402)-2'-O)-methyltransferase [Gemmatimonadaceae bacterium]|nr:16S rRNA (cytidine(1402)-2'-O)-methyltransferase [Gemmatimonadaceae bacterium]
MTGARGGLFVVSTPIGNLGDMSARAIETLRSADLVLAEDTRHSAILTSHFGVHSRVEAYHEHNEAKATPRVLQRLAGGATVALVSDAGTPLLSDPGARLVRAAIEAGFRVTPVPGASAMLAALVGSGLPMDRFTFMGFVGRKGRDRSEAVRGIVESSVTTVIYEAPGRAAALLAALRDAGAGGRAAAVARELTKQFEEFRRGTVSELAEGCAAEPPRGEVVIVVAGAAEAPEPDEAALSRRVGELRAAGLSAREVARVLSDEMGASRNTAYRLAHE